MGAVGRRRSYTFTLVTLLVGCAFASLPQDERLWRLSLENLWQRVGMSEKKTDNLHVKFESELLHPYSSGCLFNADLFQAADVLYAPEHHAAHEPHHCYFGSCSKQQEGSFSELYSTLMKCTTESPDAPHQFLNLVDVRQLIQQRTGSPFLMEGCTAGVVEKHLLAKYEFASVPTSPTAFVITLTPDQTAKGSPLPEEFDDAGFIRAVGRSGEEVSASSSLGVDLDQLVIQITLPQFAVQHIAKPVWFDQRALNSTVALFGFDTQHECSDAVDTLKQSYLPHALLVAKNPQVTLTFADPSQYRNVKNAIMQGRLKEFVVGFIRFSDHSKNVLVDDDDDSLRLSLNITSDELFHLGTVYRKLVQSSTKYPNTAISVGFDNTKQQRGFAKKRFQHAPAEPAHFVQISTAEEDTAWELSVKSSSVGARFYSTEDVDISLKLGTNARKIASAFKLAQLYYDPPKLSTESLGFTREDGVSPSPIKAQLLYEDVGRLEQADYPRHRGEEEPPTRANIWKKDPSVHFLGIRPVVLSNRVLRTRDGPQDEMFVVLQEDGTAFNIPLDKDNNAIVHFNEGEPLNVQNKLFDAVHTWAVARMVIELYQRDFAFKLRDVNARIKWVWQRQGDNSPLYLIPHAGKALNAKYTRSRRSIEFYYTPNKEDGELVFFCRSLDVVAHEVTHAIIDGVKPAWMSSKKSETLALHEALSDLTPLFLSLSMMDVVETAITRSKNNLKDPKFFLPEVAVQVGALLNYKHGLRNANNDLKGSSPISNTHDLAQVFTGFVYDVLVDAFEDTRMPEYVQDSFTLYVVSERLRRIMAFATLAAPEEDATFVDLSQGMLQAIDALNYNPEWKQWIKKNAEKRELNSVQEKSFSFAPEYHNIGCADHRTAGDFVPQPSPFTGAHPYTQPKSRTQTETRAPVSVPSHHHGHHASKIQVVVYYLLIGVPIFVLVFFIVDITVSHAGTSVSFKDATTESYKHLVELLVASTVPVKSALDAIKSEAKTLVEKLKELLGKKKDTTTATTAAAPAASAASTPAGYFKNLLHNLADCSIQVAGHFEGKIVDIQQCTNKECNFPRTRNEHHFLYVEAATDKYNTLEEAFAASYTTMTEKCSVCNMDTRSTSTWLKTVPDYFTIDLEHSSGSQGKPFTFPLNLDLTKYYEQPITQVPNFSLIGVIVQQQQTGAKPNNYLLYKGYLSSEWVKIDTTSSPASESDVRKVWSEDNLKALMLLYRRDQSTFLGRIKEKIQALVKYVSDTAKALPPKYGELGIHLGPLLIPAALLYQVVTRSTDNLAFVKLFDTRKSTIILLVSLLVSFLMGVALSPLIGDGIAVVSLCLLAASVVQLTERAAPTLVYFLFFESILGMIILWHLVRLSVILQVLLQVMCFAVFGRTLWVVSVHFGLPKNAKIETWDQLVAAFTQPPKQPPKDGDGTAQSPVQSAPATAPQSPSSQEPSSSSSPSGLDSDTTKSAVQQQQLPKGTSEQDASLKTSAPPAPAPSTSTPEKPSKLKALEDALKSDLQAIRSDFVALEEPVKVALSQPWLHVVLLYTFGNLALIILSVHHGTYAGALFGVLGLLWSVVVSPKQIPSWCVLYYLPVSLLTLGVSFALLFKSDDQWFMFEHKVFGLFGADATHKHFLHLGEIVIIRFVFSLTGLACMVSVTAWSASLKFNEWYMQLNIAGSIQQQLKQQPTTLTTTVAVLVWVLTHYLLGSMLLFLCGPETIHILTVLYTTFGVWYFYRAFYPYLFDDYNSVHHEITAVLMFMLSFHCMIHYHYYVSGPIIYVIAVVGLFHPFLAPTTVTSPLALTVDVVISQIFSIFCLTAGAIGNNPIMVAVGLFGIFMFHAYCVHRVLQNKSLLIRGIAFLVLFGLAVLLMEVFMDVFFAIQALVAATTPDYIEIGLRVWLVAGANTLPLEARLWRALLYVIL